MERKVNEMKRRTVVGEAVRRSASSPSLPPSPSPESPPPSSPPFLLDLPRGPVRTRVEGREEKTDRERGKIKKEEKRGRC